MFIKSYSISFLTIVSSVLMSSCGGSGSGNTNAASVSVSAPSPTALVTSFSGETKRLTYADGLKLSADCYISQNDFVTRAGAFSTTNNCGEFLAKTDGSSGTYSIGQFEYKNDVSTTSTIQVSMRKISGNISRPTEIYFRGGAVGWAFSNGVGYYYIYESEGHWTNWIKSEVLDPNSDNEVRTVQSDKNIKVFINGSFIDEFELNTLPERGKVSVFFKGDPNSKDIMTFYNFLVLDSDGTASDYVDVDTSIDGNFTSAVLENTQPSAVSLNFGDANDSSGALVKRITIKNTGTTPINPPKITPVVNSGLIQLNIPDPDRCSAKQSLLAGSSCFVYVQTTDESTATAISGPPGQLVAIAPTVKSSTSKSALLVSGNNYLPASISFTSIAVKNTPKVQYITPTNFLAGRRTLITVIGSDLPSTLALRITGANCENTSKPKLNQVYCTLGSSLTTKADVLTSITNTNAISSLGIRVTPALFGDPLAASYLTSIQRGYNQDLTKNNPPLGFHTGWDIMTAKSNPTVNAIADGVVKYNNTALSRYKTAHEQYWNAFIVVQHSGFCAYYGHLDNSANIKENSIVKRGSVLGKVRDAYPDQKLDTSWNHLHMSISTSGTCQSSGWGYRATSFGVTGTFSDPRGYIYIQ